MSWATVVLMCPLAYSSGGSAHQTGLPLLRWCEASDSVEDTAEGLKCYGYLWGMWKTCDVMTLLLPSASTVGARALSLLGPDPG